MTRWPDLPILGSAELPPLSGGVMVYLHGAVKAQAPKRVTHDVDVLFDHEIAPSSLQDAVKVLKQLDYMVEPTSPTESTHRYRIECWPKSTTTVSRQPFQCQICLAPSA